MLPGPDGDRLGSGRLRPSGRDTDDGEGGGPRGALAAQPGPPAVCDVLNPGLPDADSGGVTVLPHTPDWKVTTGYRIMLAMGWSAFAFSLYVAVVAIVLGLAAAWWVAGGLALVAIATVAFLPEPVPAEMIVGGRNRIDPRRTH